MFFLILGIYFVIIFPKEDHFALNFPIEKNGIFPKLTEKGLVQMSCFKNNSIDFFTSYDLFIDVNDAYMYILPIIMYNFMTYLAIKK